MKEVFLMIGKRIVLMLLCLCLLCTSLPLVAAAESPYYIRVDLTNNIVTVYSTLDDSVVRQMICSGGMAAAVSRISTSSSRTPDGAGAWNAFPYLMRKAVRRTRTVVFPLPAPARTSRGPSV